jgi:hypothetical protein
MKLLKTILLKIWINLSLKSTVAFVSRNMCCENELKIGGKNMDIVEFRNYLIEKHNIDNVDSVEVTIKIKDGETNKYRKIKLLIDEDTNNIDGNKLYDLLTLAKVFRELEGEVISEYDKALSSKIGDLELIKL